VVLDSEHFTIGRVGADFLIEDKGVSRLHLTVHLRGQEILLEDMNSANGTFVGGQKLPAGQPTRYPAGTAVQLGICKDLLVFEVVERTLTKSESEALTADLVKHPSRALSSRPPSIEAEVQADRFLNEAREMAATMRDSAARESESVLQSARQKATDTLTEARTEASKILEKARKTASQSTLEREAAAEAALTTARREALTIKTSADEEAERIVREARASANQARIDAQEECDEMMRTTRTQVASLKEQAEVEAREVIRISREKSRQLTDQASAEVEKTIAQARETAAKIRAEADQIRDTARAQLQEKEAQVLREAKAQADAIRASATAEAERAKEEARAEGLRTIEFGLKEAEAEIARFKQSAKKDIDQLNETIERLNGEIRDIHGAREAAEAETVAARQQADTAKAELIDVRNLLEQAKVDHEELRAVLAQSIQEREEAVQMRESALRIKADAEREAEELRRQSQDQRAAVARELKEVRDKGLLEFEDRKKAQVVELANMKLKMIEEVKARQLEDERQLKGLRVHQAAELGRQLEDMLVAKIQAKIFDVDTTPVIADLRKEVIPMVKELLTRESGPQGPSEVVHEISSDPIVERLKKRERMRVRMMVAAPAIAFVLAVFLPEYFEPIRRPGDLISGGKSVAQIIAERRAHELASKKVFNPPQTEELGATYTDRVLYTKDYVGLKLKTDNYKQWAVNLEDYMFREMGLPEQVTSNFVIAETRLIRELQQQREGINPNFVEEGIARMRSVEEQAMAELKGKIGGDVAFDKIREYEKKFFAKLREVSGADSASAVLSSEAVENGAQMTPETKPDSGSSP